MDLCSNRLYELLDYVLDGSCTDDQRSEFSALLDENPESISELTKEVMVHSLLHWRSEETVGFTETEMES
jgi:hypothetical protein